jgi:hypothetical protein
MNGREISNAGGKNWILSKEMNANRFFLEAHWLEIWSNHFCPSMGPNGGSVAMDSVLCRIASLAAASVIESPLRLWALLEIRARICKRLRSPGIGSTSLFSMAGRYK